MSEHATSRRAENAAVLVTIWATLVGLLMVYVGLFIVTFAVTGVLVWVSAWAMWLVLGSTRHPTRLMAGELLLVTLVLPCLAVGWTHVIVTG